MEGYKAIGGQKNLKGTFRLLSKGRLIFEWKHFSRLQIQTTKKKRSILAVIWLLINYFFSFPSNCGQDCCLLKCWITSHWKTKYAMGNNLILGKGRISVQQILKTFFRRFIKYSSRSCRRNQFTSL